MASFFWPPIGSGSVVPTYANLAAFPSAVTSGNGSLAIALDTNILYESNGTTWIAIGGPGAVLSIGALDGTTASSNGAAITADVLYMQSASATMPGLVNTTTQTMAGAKTFSGNMILGGTLNVTSTTTLATSLTGVLKATAGVVSTQAVGDLTDVGTDGITIGSGTGAVIGSGTTISQHVADATHNGYLSSADWTTFNGKQDAGSYITALTGDVTASGPGSAAATLATVNSNVGSFTNASITVNAKGLVTAASNGTTPVTALGAVGSSPNANAATLTTGTLNLEPASASFPGVVTTGAQTIAGVKTFSSAPVMSALSASQAVVTDSGKALASLAYTNLNTVSTLVQRDGSGNFSAGTITAALTGTASGNTTISGQTNHGVVVASATNAMTSTAAGSSGQPLLSGGSSADPAYGTLGAGAGGTSLTSSGSAGNLLISNGTTWTSGTYNEPYMARNYSLAASVSANALTITLNDFAGSTPSASSPVQIAFRNATNATGTFSTGTATGATTLVISSGSTLGQANGIATNIWVYAQLRAGAIELAASTTLFDTSVVLSSTTEGAGGTADSNAIIYATTFINNAPMRCIGKIVSSQATAGTWASAPTSITCNDYDSPLAFDPICVYAYNTAGTTVNNTSPVVPFATKVYDTHNAWGGASTDTFTAPVGGKYHLSTGVYMTVNNSTSQGMQCLPVVAGTTLGGPFVPGVGASNTFSPQVSRTFTLAAGDTIQVKYYSDVSGTLNTTASRNYISIERVG